MSEFNNTYSVNPNSGDICSLSMHASEDNTHAIVEFQCNYEGKWMLKAPSGKFVEERRVFDFDGADEQWDSEGITAWVEHQEVKVTESGIYTLHFWRTEDPNIISTATCRYLLRGVTVFEANSEDQIEKQPAVPWIYNGEKWLLATPFVCVENEEGKLVWKPCERWEVKLDE